MITKNICTKNEEGRINGSFRVCHLMDTDMIGTSGYYTFKTHCKADMDRAKLVTLNGKVFKDTRNAAQKEACKK